VDLRVLGSARIDSLRQRSTPARAWCGEDSLQTFSGTELNARAVGACAPMDAGDGGGIGTLVFAPHAARQTCTKQQMHADELLNFATSAASMLLRLGGQVTAAARCHESLQSGHAAPAARMVASAYLTGIAKTASGLSQTYPQ
jgi:hypothetical protein